MSACKQPKLFRDGECVDCPGFVTCCEDRWAYINGVCHDKAPSVMDEIWLTLDQVAPICPEPDMWISKDSNNKLTCSMGDGRTVPGFATHAYDDDDRQNQTVSLQH